MFFFDQTQFGKNTTIYILIAFTTYFFKLISKDNNFNDLLYFVFMFMKLFLVIVKLFYNYIAFWVSTIDYEIANIRALYFFIFILTDSYHMH